MKCHHFTKTGSGQAWYKTQENNTLVVTPGDTAALREAARCAVYFGGGPAV